MHTTPMIMASAVKPRTAAECQAAWDSLNADAERMDALIESIRPMLRMVAGWFARQPQTFRPAHA